MFVKYYNIHIICNTVAINFDPVDVDHENSKEACISKLERFPALAIVDTCQRER